MAWVIERSRQLTKKERKVWPRRAKLETQKALIEGFVSMVGFHHSFPPVVQDDLLRMSAARYVASCQDKSGARRASQILYVHEFVIEVMRFVERKNPELGFNRNWSARTWPSVAVADFWEKVTQWAMDPSSANAIRGGMELELEAVATARPIFTATQRAWPYPQHFVDYNSLIQSGASDMFMLSKEMEKSLNKLKHVANGYIVHRVHDAFVLERKKW